MTERKAIRIQAYVMLAFVAGVAFALWSGGCATGHFQVFRVADEDDFSAWVESMRRPTAAETAEAIGAWEVANQQYEGGLHVWGVMHYLDAWGQRTNCQGAAMVAVEALHRLGFTDFRMVEVLYPAPPDEPGNDWHVVASDCRSYLSNGRYRTMPEGAAWRDVAALANHNWTLYRLRDRNGSILEEVSR